MQSSKKNYTKEDIMNLVEEEDVEFIRLQFTDMFGCLKNMAITSFSLSGFKHPGNISLETAAGKGGTADL